MSQRLPLVGAVERALYLRSLPFLRDLQPSELAACAQLVEEVSLHRGTVLYDSTRGVRAVYLIADGRVRIERRGRVVERLESPHMAGLVELLAGDDDIPRAITDSRVLALSIDSGALFDLLEDHFTVVLQARRALGEQMAYLQAKTGLYELPTDGRETRRLKIEAHQLDHVQRLLVIQRAPLFRGVGLGVLAALTRSDCEVRIPAGTVLWEAGSEADHLALIVRGGVACRPPKGPVFRLSSGAAVGAEALFGGIPRAYAARAEEDIVALRLDAATLLDLAEDHFDLALRLLSFLARAVLRLEERRETA